MSAKGLKYLITLLCGLIIISSKAQTVDSVAYYKVPTRHLVMGVSANAYRGDLTQNYESWSSSFQLGLQFQKKGKWSTYLGLGIGNVRGENFAYEFEGGNPNTFFNTQIINIQGILQYHFIMKENWSVYLYQGIGILRFIPKDENAAPLSEHLQTRAADESYNNITLILPSGLGSKFHFKNGYGVGVQAHFVHPLSDYIDNISNWGFRKGNDNVFMVTFFLEVPIHYLDQVRLFRKEPTKVYSH